MEGHHTPHSEATKMKIRNTLIAKGIKPITAGWNKGLLAWNHGKTKKDFPQFSNSGVKIGNTPWNKGKKGIYVMEKSGNWRGGISKNPQYSGFMKARYRMKKLSNGGTHTFVQWNELKKLYNYMCLCCKQQEPFVRLTEDHIVPVSMGGSDHITNIQPLCQSCNSKKRTRTINYLEGAIPSPLSPAQPLTATPAPMG